MRQEAVSFDELSHRELLKIDPIDLSLLILLAIITTEGPSYGG
jgi:hypothetical protein